MHQYLEAKRTVDDRALNRRVLERFAAALSDYDDPVRIVELGAGVGTMIVRLAEWDLLPANVSYRAVDHDRASIDRARELVPVALEDAGYDVAWRDSTDCDAADVATLVATRGVDARQHLEITFTVADALSLDATATADAVVAAAFLDLVDLADSLPAIESLLGDGGVLYAPITFDSGTKFAPQDRLDDRIERQYHRHMDAVRDGGRSDSGRELLTRLPSRGWTVLDAGGSDWIVRPVDEDGAEDRGRTYPATERAVVDHVLETIEDALADLPADAAAIDPDERTRWLERRRRELAAGELVFVVTNVDVLSRVPDT